MVSRPPLLDDSAKIELLRLARQTLESYLSCGESPRFVTNCPQLHERCGAFVSLHRGKELRGCIGLVAPADKLYRTVQRCAISSAVDDTRFPPVSYEELRELTIEVSVLSRLWPVKDPGEIEIGKHGLLISRGQRRGLLLPQVATAQRWDRETFLSQTCYKAGLPPDAWRDLATVIEFFTAQVFSE